MENTTMTPELAAMAAEAMSRIADMSPETLALVAEIKALKAQNVALKSKATAKTVKGLSLRVSVKGALSLYGVGRWPVTLYREQWTKLLDVSEDIRAFIAANNDALKFKAEAGDEE